MRGDKVTGRSGQSSIPPRYELKICADCRIFGGYSRFVLFSLTRPPYEAAKDGGGVSEIVPAIIESGQHLRRAIPIP